jgi:hypothetical protein
MFEDRTSPKHTAPLVGSCISFGAQFRSHQGSLAGENDKNQERPKNFCDHHPNNMRGFDRPSEHKKRYQAIEECIEKLNQALETPRQILKNLFYPQKKKRSQRREAIVRVLQVMLHYMDMESFQVGFLNDKLEFIRFDLKKIAQYAKINFSRAKRAIKDIECAGYIKIQEQYETLADGSKRALAAIKTFTRKFFREIGIDHLKLFQQREHKRKENEKKFLPRAKEMWNQLLAMGKGLNNIPFSQESELRKNLRTMEKIALFFRNLNTRRNE